MVDECGTENDPIVVPADGTGYSFSGTGGDVYLTAAANHAFPVGTETEWNFVLTDVPCVTPPGEILPPVPDFTDADCDTPAALSLPGFDHGTWSWGGESGASFSGEPANLEFGVPFEVTAVADDGFIIPGTAVWSFTPVEPTDCGGVADDVTIPLEPVTMTDACGPDNEVVSTPEPRDGVVYSRERSATTVTVVATAVSGFFVLSYEGEVTDTVRWEFAVNDEACPVDVPDPVIDPPIDPPADPPADDPPAVDPPAVDPPAVDPPAVDPPAVDPPPTVDPPAVDPPPTVDPPAVDPPAVTPAVVTARPLVLASAGVEADGLGILALLLLLVGAVVVAVGRRHSPMSPSGETRQASRHAEHRRLRVGELWAHGSHGGVRAGTVHRH